MKLSTIALTPSGHGNRSKTHRHHILPKHAGGSDDPSNLVDLTVEQHAEAHRLLWEEYGNKKDFIAWKTLSGQITSDEARREVARHVMSTRERSPDEWTKGWETRRQKAGGIWVSPMKGKNMPLSEEARTRMREAKLGSEPWNKGMTGTKNNFPVLSNTIWINNGMMNKRVPKDSLIPDGFVMGRKKK
jgi:hypothetical protein